VDNPVSPNNSQQPDFSLRARDITPLISKIRPLRHKNPLRQLVVLARVRPAFSNWKVSTL
jgi:hypothetical protein